MGEWTMRRFHPLPGYNWYVETWITPRMWEFSVTLLLGWWVEQGREYGLYLSAGPLSVEIGRTQFIQRGREDFHKEGA